MGRVAEGLTPRLNQVRTWHKSMARMMVTGTRPGELCKIFGMTPTQITIITQSPLFIEYLAALEGRAEAEVVNVREELQLRQGLVVEVIDRALLSEDLKLATGTAFEILDRTGYGKGVPAQKHLHLHAHAELKEMDEEDLAQVVMDLASEEG